MTNRELLEAIVIKLDHIDQRLDKVEQRLDKATIRFTGTTGFQFRIRSDFHGAPHH